MHGDETVGRMLVIYFAEYLLQNYVKGDTRVKKIVDDIGKQWLRQDLKEMGSQALLQGPTPIFLTISTENWIILVPYF